MLAGKEYGTGSSRDWAAKGPALLGVRVVIAESYERIHRSNLVGMGILPLQFEPGVNAHTLGLTGDEEFDIVDLESALQPRRRGSTCGCAAPTGPSSTFPAVVRLDASVDVIYYRHGGIMPRVLRLMLEACGDERRAAVRRGFPKIQLLHTLGCDDDNTAQARAALDQALAQVGIDAGCGRRRPGRDRGAVGGARAWSAGRRSWSTASTSTPASGACAPAALGAVPTSRPRASRPRRRWR